MNDNYDEVFIGFTRMCLHRITDRRQTVRFYVSSGRIVTVFDACGCVLDAPILVQHFGNNDEVNCDERWIFVCHLVGL